MIVRRTYEREIHPILGRPEQVPPLEEPLALLRRERVVVTGARGGLGRALVATLNSAGIRVCATDVETLDVTAPLERTSVQRATLLFHLAAEKDACDGEASPERALLVNALGTANVLSLGLRTVFASTCKAAAPETVYGASKLIGERLTLNAGGSVARLFNVYDTPRNVFATWAALAKYEPLPVTDCVRYFISSREAVALLLWTAALEPGRYALGNAAPRRMRDVAASLYPGRATRTIARRRGDRAREPFSAPYETVVAAPAPGLVRIRSAHDAAPLDAGTDCYRAGEAAVELYDVTEPRRSFRR